VLKVLPGPRPLGLLPRILRGDGRPDPRPAFFDNQIATLELEDRSATITFEKAVLDASKVPVLEKLYEYRLA
jgi:hypothetical protein